MPCVTTEQEHYVKSMEKLTRDMCSTPHPVNDEDDMSLYSFSCKKNNYDAFDKYYDNIERELEKLKRIGKENDQCIQRLLSTYGVDSMLEKWQKFEEKTDEEDKCFLQRNIMELGRQLSDISVKISSMEFQIKDKHQLEKNFQNVKNELDYFEDKKKLITEYNVKAHRLLNDSKCSTLPLKDDINNLYRIYEETRQKFVQQVTTLRQALFTWSQFDMYMLDLKTVLREDHNALDVLDQALKQDECVAENMAFTVKNITKYLPDKHRDHLIKTDNNNMMTLDIDHVDSTSSFVMTTFNVEGSLSDSGISDSGSEQDMCEREKRLVILKKLARQLESILAPGSEALRSIKKRIDEAELEIRELQQTCRTIIKTGYLENEDQIAMKKDVSSKNNFQNNVKNVKKTGSGDPETDPGKGRSFFWRVLRAALPFHIAIVVLLCVACLLEPNCCDAINNLNLSLTPQLRYISGPPPT